MNEELIRAWLIKQNWKPERLAVRLGVSAGTIYRILSGQYVPSKPIIIALAAVMKCAEEDLLITTPPTAA